MASPRAQQAYAFYIQRGYTPAQAAGIVGNLMQESGPNLDLNATGDNGTAFGLAQWRGDRFTGLQSYASQNGLNWRDFDTQLAYVDHELNTTESRAGQALRNATTVGDATAAMIGFERPQGWTSSNPTGGHGWNNRLAYASELTGTQPMAYTGSQNAPAGQAAITAATGPGQDVTAPAPAPGSQRLFMPIRDAIAARQAGGTPRLDELRNIREQRMAGEHPLLDRLRNFFQSVGGNQPEPSASAPRPPAPIPYAGGGGGSRSDPAVAQLQQQLAAAGFNPGPIDGIMGPRTRAAMQARDAAGGMGAPGQGGGMPQTGAPSTVVAQQGKGFGLLDAIARNFAGSGQQQSAGPVGPKAPPPLPPPNPMRGGGAPMAGGAPYNPAAPLNYGLPIAPQGPAPISAPAPGGLMAGSLTPSGPSGFGSYNPTANLNFGIPISPTGPASVPTPSVNRTLGPMLAGYDTPGNGVGVPTTPVSRGVLPDPTPSWPQTADGQTMWTDPAWRSSPGAGVGVAAPVAGVERGSLPPVRPAPNIDPAQIIAGLQQIALNMPGWGPSGGPSSGPGAGGRPVQVRPTTTVPSQQWNIPGERERAMNNGLMPAGRDNFSASNGGFRYLPAFSDPNPMTFLPNGVEGTSRPVQSTTPPMGPGIPHRGLPVAEYWRRLLATAGV